MGIALQTILDEITEIKDNGNNTAAELRKVLTDMLEYSNDGFEIAIDTLVITDTQLYQYSFKGTKKQCCNLFLILQNKGAGSTTMGGNFGATNVFTFEIQKEEYDILRDFVPDIQENRVPLTYVLPIVGRDHHRIAMVVLRKQLDPADNKLKHYVLVHTDLVEEEGTITTLPLNYIKTVFPANNKKAEASFNKAVNFSATFKDFK